MGLRLDLHAKLVSLLGSSNVYFQPPASVVMKYPCIIYSLSDINSRYADDLGYTNTRQYTLIYVDLNPDSLMPDKLLYELPYTSFDRHYTSENLHHSVLITYF